MGNQHEFRQLTPRKGLGVVIPIRLGHTPDVDRILGEPTERYRFYISIVPAGETIEVDNLDWGMRRLDAQPYDCVTIQSGGKMWCGYDVFIQRIRDLAPFLDDALFYVGDELDFIDEFRLIDGALHRQRLHRGYYLDVRKFLRSRGIRQTPNALSMGLNRSQPLAKREAGAGDFDREPDRQNADEESNPSLGDKP
ncbi:MAG: hypothetical protein ACRC8S_10705 [Fimbriiglobus sp.]